MAGTGKELRHDPAHQRAAALARHASTIPTALTQAADLQLALHSAGLAMSDDLKTSEDKGERARAASALAGVSKGWQSMNDQVRILKGRPLPGSLRPNEKPKTKVKDQVSPLPENHSP